eukprot:257076_1
MDTKCTLQFSECASSNRIKSILNRSDKEKSKQATRDSPNLAIIFDKQYSAVQLLNDFYHIKYAHNTNEDPNKFNSFYHYLSDNDNALDCDINDCQHFHRYFNRKTKFMLSENVTQETHTIYLISRIHTYFLHAHDGSQLSHDEIKYIEEQLTECKENDEDSLHDTKIQLTSSLINNKNKLRRSLYTSDNSKFITTEHIHSSMDFKQISRILAENNINITEAALVNTFDPYGYHKHQLIRDLFDVLISKKEECILSRILINELKYDQNEREVIYVMLCHDYIMTNTEDFIQVLQMIASKFAPQVDSDEIGKIVRSLKLTGKLFNKKSTEFKNSIAFSKVFKNINNWNKKQWTKIYKTINKWKSTKLKPTSVVIHQVVADNEITQPDLDGKYAPELESSDEKVNGIGHETDSQLVEKFCIITHATKSKAVSFLKAAEWNITFAIDKYYAFNGNVTKLSTDYYHNEIDDGDEEFLVYNHGIAFWRSEE